MNGAAAVENIRNHPLLKELPVLAGNQDLIRRIIVKPDFDPEYRLLENSVRYVLAEKIYEFIYPLPIFSPVMLAFDGMIRASYLRRDPRTSEHLKRLYKVTDSMRAHTSIGRRHRCEAGAMLVFGCSGMGKSTMGSALLSLYPEVIAYGTGDFLKGEAQIPIVLLRMPPNGSLKDMCFNFFGTVDDILNTSYFTRRFGRGRSNIDDLMTSMGQLCGLLNVGALIWDEAQDLSKAKGMGREVVMNHHLKLRTHVGVPVFYIGTYQMMDLFEGDIRLARRFAQNGVFEVPRCSKADDPIFRSFVEACWELLVVRRPAPLSKEIYDTAYELSQGVWGILCPILHHAQVMAIADGSETINQETLRSAFETRCQTMHAAVFALSTRDSSVMSQYEHLYHPAFDRNLGGKAREQLYLQRLRQRGVLQTRPRSGTSRSSAGPRSELPSQEQSVQMEAGDSGAADWKEVRQ